MMGYGFRNGINPRGKTPESVEAYADFVTGHYRGKESPFSRGDKGVFRPRRLKDCYCGGHSTRKPTLNRNNEQLRYLITLMRRAKEEERDYHAG